MTVTDIAIVGVGKIARDQHVPAIAADPRFRLAATVSRSGGVEGVENFDTLDALLASRPKIGAVSLCMPPQARFEPARAALAAGRHVMLEKPPGATLAEVETLTRLASDGGQTLFATWHSRHAAAVAPAKDWLATRTVRRVAIVWREDVRRWHPGQDWIWEPGGLGVFDPGINALSIMTEILPVPLHLTGAELEVPANRQTPIAVRLAFAGPGGATGTADFDWRQEGPQTWEIEVETDKGSLRLTEGGAGMAVDGSPVAVETQGEYPGLYARFADLIARGASDADTRPLMQVADAFMLGRRIPTDEFHD
ncbi:Gfo/Idh/MocA family protein [Jannaschia formosa]|uniref:Gfo/Idh/MocA family protein n=1 Tax=Jannaschia formosa TaxID=2259592 RepID=UPI000E1BA188|nr:Gfo/Idh/MocA family oxidoreductase [Jannaschia formosa]TFL17537.1 Gfo/Idh/MocA family oxidoreductase [Jannaschia formosa]